jgi:hypothetical protein
MNSFYGYFTALDTSMTPPTAGINPISSIELQCNDSIDPYPENSSTVTQSANTKTSKDGSRCEYFIANVHEKSVTSEVYLTTGDNDTKVV